MTSRLGTGKWLTFFYSVRPATTDLSLRKIGCWQWHQVQMSLPLSNSGAISCHNFLAGKNKYVVFLINVRTLYSIWLQYMYSIIKQMLHTLRRV